MTMAEKMGRTSEELRQESAEELTSPRTDGYAMRAFLLRLTADLIDANSQAQLITDAIGHATQRIIDAILDHGALTQGQTQRIVDALDTLAGETLRPDMARTPILQEWRGANERSSYPSSPPPREAALGPSETAAGRAAPAEESAATTPPPSKCGLCGEEFAAIVDGKLSAEAAYHVLQHQAGTIPDQKPTADERRLRRHRVEAIMGGEWLVELDATGSFVEFAEVREAIDKILADNYRANEAAIEQSHGNATYFIERARNNLERLREGVMP